MIEEEKTQELVVIDINKYRQVKRALRESESQYRELFDNVPIALFQTDENFNVLNANRAFLEIFDLEKAEPFNLKALLGPIADKIASSDDVLGWETGHSTLKGDQHFLRVNIGKKRAGERLFYSGSIEDISENVQISENLKLEKEKLESVLENAPYGIFITDEQDAIIFCNQSFKTITGLRDEEIRGRDFSKTLNLGANDLKFLRYFQKKQPPQELQVEAVLAAGDKKRLKILSTQLPSQNSIYFFYDISRELNREKAINCLNQLIMAGNRAEQLPPLLELIFTVVASLNEFEAGAIFLSDGESGEIRLSFHRNLNEQELRYCQELLLENFFQQAVLLDKESLFSDSSTELAARSGEGQNLFQAFVPLLSKDELIGTMMLFSRKLALLSEDEKAYLETIGREAGTLIRKTSSEQTLRKKEEIYRKTFNFIPDYAFLLCENGGGRLSLIAANDQASSNLRNYLRFYLGKTVEEIFPEQPELLRELHEAFRRKSFKKQLRVQFRQSASHFWFDLYSVRISEHEMLLIAKDITSQKRREEEIQEYQQRLRKLSLDLTLLEERERKQISRELHDGLAQNLALCNMLLSNLDNGRTPDKENLARIKKLVEESISITRSLIFDLSPPILYELGINRALEWLAEKAGQQFGFRVNLNLQVNLELSSEHQYLVFKSVQELLNNCGKHSAASEVEIETATSNGCYLITVSDNGRGFEPSRQKSPGRDHFGLFNINERISFIGGEVEILSLQGKGTRITLKIPVKNEE